MSKTKNVLYILKAIAGVLLIIAKVIKELKK
jgi:hypothetical protein